MSRLQTETHARAHNEKEEQEPARHSPALPSGSVLSAAYRTLVKGSTRTSMGRARPRHLCSGGMCAGRLAEERRYLTQALEILDRLGTPIAPDKARRELADLPG